MSNRSRTLGVHQQYTSSVKEKKEKEEVTFEKKYRREMVEKYPKNRSQVNKRLLIRGK